MTETTFLLIRHGLTDAVGRVMMGRRPGVRLNAVGRAQAARLAETLRSTPLAAVVSSPLERTRETAEAIARPHGLAVEIADGLLEYEVGGWTGSTFADLDATAEWRRFNTLRSLTAPPDGELMIGVQQRAVAALLDLRAEYSSGIVAAVSHGDVIRALLLFFLGMPIDFLHRLEVSPATISIVTLGPGEPRVLQVNGDSMPAAT
jgi:probable phosphoglycerate mutase